MVEGSLHIYIAGSQSHSHTLTVAHTLLTVDLGLVGSVIGVFARENLRLVGSVIRVFAREDIRLVGSVIGVFARENLRLVGSVIGVFASDAASFLCVSAADFSRFVSSRTSIHFLCKTKNKNSLQR